MDIRNLSEILRKFGSLNSHLCERAASLPRFTPHTPNVNGRPPNLSEESLKFSSHNKIPLSRQRGCLQNTTLLGLWGTPSSGMNFLSPPDCSQSSTHTNHRGYTGHLTNTNRWSTTSTHPAYKQRNTPRDNFCPGYITPLSTISAV